tara:strand:- start:17375 stop:17629 length:255 start_codon:yes stop_codon:yes gene_type:complete
MSYESNIGYLHDIIWEAKREKVSPETAKRWAAEHLYEYDSYNDIKDLAFHMGIASVEVAHPSTVRASLIALMVKEMLKPFKEEE